MVLCTTRPVLHIDAEQMRLLRKSCDFRVMLPGYGGLAELVAVQHQQGHCDAAGELQAGLEAALSAGVHRGQGPAHPGSAQAAGGGGAPVVWGAAHECH